METARITLRGEIAASPEIRYRRDGNPVALLRVTTTRWRTRNGLRQQVSDSHPVVVYDEAIIHSVRDFRKGDQVVIGGALQLRTFTDSARVTRTVAEVVLHPRHGNAQRLPPVAAA